MKPTKNVVGAEPTAPPTTQLTPLAQAGPPAAPVTSRREIAVRTNTTSIAVVPPETVDVVEDVDVSEGRPAESGPRTLPIFRLLQSNSPQVKRGHGMYIAGAKDGDLINTATSEIYDGEMGLFIIPVLARHAYVDYIRRNKDGTGGGFQGVYEPEHPIVQAAKERYQAEHGNLFGKLPNGMTEPEDDEPARSKDLVETFYIDCVCVVPNPDGTFPAEYGPTFDATISFQSTHIKEYKSWDNRCRNMTYNVRAGDRVVPRELTLWSHVWRLRSRLRQEGNLSWMVPRITLGGVDADGVELPYKHSRQLRNDPLYLRAENLHTEVLEGTVQYAYNKDVGEGAEQTQDQNDDPPFGDKID